MKKDDNTELLDLKKISSSEQIKDEDFIHFIDKLKKNDF